MIRANKLTKRFGDTVAVNELSLNIESGTWFLMVGHNGAGKTTTIRMLAALLPASEGEMAVAGVSPRLDPVTVRRKVGYLPEKFEPYDYLTPREYLRFIAEVHAVDPDTRDSAIERLLELLELSEHGDSLIRSFSQGMKKKVGLSACLIHDPPVLFLDEPTATLDPRTSHLIRQLIRELCNRGKTVFMSTHILGIAEQQCDRIVVLDKGKIQLDSTPDSLSESHPGKSLEEIFVELSGGGTSDRLDKFLEGVRS